MAICAPCLIACDRDEGPAPAQVGAKPDVEDIADQPARYFGKTVTVYGEIENIRGPRAFMIEDTGWLWDDEIPVVTRAPVALGGAPLDEDDEVIVTGIVRPMAIVELERELGWDLDPELEAEIRTRPVLVAQSIRRVGEYARWSATDPDQTSVEMLSMLSAPDPSKLIGQRVSFDRVTVQAVTPRALWVGPSSASQVLVVPTDAKLLSGLEVGSEIEVAGSIKELPPAKQAAREFGIAQERQDVLAKTPVYVEATKLQRVRQEPTAQVTDPRR